MAQRDQQYHPDQLDMFDKGSCLRINDYGGLQTMCVMQVNIRGQAK
jgi:hypothetical protein